MNRKALYDANGVLRSHGYVNFIAGLDETVRDVEETFDLKSGQWKWNGTTHVPYVPPKSEADNRKADALAKLDAAANDNGIPLKIREALSALRVIL